MNTLTYRFEIDSETKVLLAMALKHERDRYEDNAIESTIGRHVEFWNYRARVISTALETLETLIAEPMSVTR